MTQIVKIPITKQEIVDLCKEYPHILSHKWDKEFELYFNNDINYIARKSMANDVHNLLVQLIQMNKEADMAKAIKLTHALALLEKYKEQIIIEYAQDEITNKQQDTNTK